VFDRLGYVGEPGDAGSLGPGELPAEQALGGALLSLLTAPALQHRFEQGRLGANRHHALDQHQRRRPSDSETCGHLPPPARRCVQRLNAASGATKTDATSWRQTQHRARIPYVTACLADKAANTEQVAKTQSVMA
jgi:hypothetical protein